MTRTKVQAGFDTWADSAKPSSTHGDEKALHVASGAANAYIHTAMPAPRGATIVSAILTVYAKGASSGSRDLNVKALAGPWKARTLNWNNRPGAAGAGVTTTVGALGDKDPVQFDVTTMVQAVASGTAKNYGWRLTSTGSDHKFYSAQAGLKPPALVVTYSEAPGKPTNLRPGGGLVGVAQPTLQWDYVGAEDLASFKIQADPAMSALPAYSSGTQVASDPIFPLAGTSFNQLASDGNLTYWRVLVTDTAGQDSAWSDWVPITRDNKGALTITNPGVSPNNFVTEPTPPILFTLTGETLAAFKVTVTPVADRASFLHDSGKIAGTTGAYTLPAGTAKKPILVSGQTYSLRVRAFDTKTRQGSAAAGDEPYVEVWRDFTMNESGTVTTPGIGTATQFGATPAVTVTFTRSTAPDSFVILRDGVELAAEVLPGDVLVSGTSYQYRDWSALPGVAHAYQVRAVVNGVQSTKSSTATVAGGTQVTGLWVADPATDRYFVLWGTEVSSWAQTEVGVDYWPLGSRTSFRVTEALGGLTGSFAGQMGNQGTRTVAQMTTDLWAMKQDAPHSENFRLVVGYLNLPVRIFDLTYAPNDSDAPGQPIRNVSFTFAQTGDFEFEGRV